VVKDNRERRDRRELLGRAARYPRAVVSPPWDAGKITVEVSVGRKEVIRMPLWFIAFLSGVVVTAAVASAAGK
jgi:hypothetical protein